MALTDHNPQTTRKDETASDPRGAGRAVSADSVQEYLGGRAILDYPVAELTTYKVGGRARFYFVAESIADLEAVSALHRETELEVLVLGRGSNVLFADSGYQGLVMQMGQCASSLEIPAHAVESNSDEFNSDESSSTVFVRAGGSIPLPVVARQTARAGLRGFEWAVGVPGTIGGGVRMNAGGHGSDMAETVRSARILDLSNGAVTSVPVEEMGLRFRGSALTDADIVLEATLELRRGSTEAAIAEIDEIVKWRRAHQPGGQNAGSVFVNPVPHEISAGELIDRCGRRGFRLGSAQISEKHANFIQADPQGTANDVLMVMRAVRTEVARQTGFVMRSEVRLVGFPPDVVDEFSADQSAVDSPARDI